MIDIQYRSAVQLVRAIDAFGAQPSGGLIVGPATTRIDAGTILELAAQTLSVASNPSCRGLLIGGKADSDAAAR
jgi:hypothetical protein